MNKVKGYKTIAFVGGAVGTVIIILRALTDSPMFKK